MKSYFRFLSRNKLYTAIEVVGLSVALAFVIPLIGYYSNIHMISKGHDNYKNIYSMCCDRVQVSSPGFGDFLKERVPEIKKISSPILDNRPKIIENQLCKINYIDKEFFYFFPVKFIGGCADFIETPGQIAVSSKFAGHLSQSGPVIGRKISHENKDYTISAIFDNYGNGVLSYCDILMSNEKIKISKSNDFPFGIRGSLTIFSVTESSDRNDVTGKVRKAACEYWGGMDSKYRDEDLYRLVRYDEMTTDDSAFIGISSNPKSVSIVLGIVFIFLFLIPILNYINLTTALTTRRAKEMTMRKLNGASRHGIILKYCAESISFTAITFLIGLVLSEVTSDLLYRFILNTGLGHAEMSVKWTVGTISLFILLILITGLICSIIPAALVSRFSLSEIAKGDYRYYRKRILNRLFIGFQSMISIIFIAITMLMETQYIKLKTVEYNCDIEDVFWFCPTSGKYKTEKMMNILKDRPEILKIGFTNDIPGACSQGMAKSSDGTDVLFSLIHCDEDAFDAMGFEIMTHISTNSRLGIWMTPLAQQKINEHPGLLENILDRNHLAMTNIAGCVNNFPSQSYRPIDECINIVDTPERLWQKNLAIKTISDHDAARKVIDDAYRSIKVSDDVHNSTYAYNYAKEIHLSQIAEFNSILSLLRLIVVIVILMTMMGMIGMSLYFISERRQEIAIRKVFGGTTDSETVRNIISFMKLTFTSSVVAVPVIYILFRKMTVGIADRVESTWHIYVIAILISLIISIISVLWQTLRAARTNPAEALKKE